MQDLIQLGFNTVTGVYVVAGSDTINEVDTVAGANLVSDSDRVVEADTVPFSLSFIMLFVTKRK